MVVTVIEKNLIASLPSRLSDWTEAKSIVLVCDDTTYQVMGEALKQVLSPVHSLKIMSLGKKPKASLVTAQQVADQCDGVAAVISVGSGTITDLCKYAAHQKSLDHIACATAPSMNGYTSSTSSLSDGGMKQSFATAQPKVVLADVEILAASPRRLIRAGLGDVMCRSTVQADWLLSNRLLGTPYDASLFDRWVPLEAELVAQSIRLTEKDPTFIKLLMRMLLVSGEAMHKAGSSAPASQGEHMIAHLFEMLYGDEQAVESFHGEQIAVTTLTMTRIQDKLLLKKPKIKANTESPEKFQRLFGKDKAPLMMELHQRKALSQSDAAELSARLDTLWPEIKVEMEAIRLKSALLENALKKANCPMSYRDVSWHKDRYEHVVTHAYLSRDRFTFLDLMAMDAGMRAGI